MKLKRSFSVRSALQRRAGETNTSTIIIIVLAAVGAIMLLICGGLAAILLPAVQKARQAARATQARNNLKIIGLGLLNYHDVYNTFPPSGIYGADGTAFHSWQTALLPYVDQAPLFSSINTNVPWNDPVNAGKFRFPVQTYLNPSIPQQTDASGFALSHYAGNSQAMLPNSKLTFRDITDGSSNTILVGEVAAGFKPWGDPANVRDPAAGLLHDANTFGTVNRQSGSVEFLMVDGATRRISVDIDPDVLKALATPSGNEQIPPGSF